MAEVLLLNASYEPLAVITRRRAVALLLKGRVEAACSEEVEVQGASRPLHIPTVMRLRRYVNVPRRSARWSKRAVLQRDKYTCAYCGLRPGDLQRGQILTRPSFTIDHILPVSRGGKNSWGNTVWVCFISVEKLECKACLAIQQSKLCTPVAPALTRLKHTHTVCACAHCNQRKGNRTPHEANLKLLWEPKTPRVNYLVASGAVPATWKVYLEI